MVTDGTDVSCLDMVIFSELGNTAVATDQRRTAAGRGIPMTRPSVPDAAVEFIRQTTHLDAPALAVWMNHFQELAKELIRKAKMTSRAW